MSVRFLRLWLHGSLKTALSVALGVVAVVSLAPAQTASSTEMAAATFKANCATCHAEDGSGTALGRRLHVKDLRTKEVQEQSTPVLAQTINEGKEQMPGFKEELDGDTIQRLIDYIRQQIPKMH